MITRTLFLCLMPFATFAGQGYLENPSASATESGIGVISGWHCTAKTISMKIDGINMGNAGSGTRRGDTVTVCGKSETGFSLLVNFSAFAPGAHTLETYADGQLMDTRTFNTARSGGEEYLQGASKSLVISDFPSTGSSSVVAWSQAKQSFVVTTVGNGLETYACEQTAKLEGTWTVYKSNASTSYSSEVLTLNTADMIHYPNSKEAPCIILGKDSLGRPSMGAAYSPTLDQFMLYKSNGFISDFYYLSQTSGSRLDGYTQQYWTSDYTPLSNTKYAAYAVKK